MSNENLNEKYARQLDDLLYMDPCFFERSRANGAVESMGRQFVAGVVVGGSGALAGALLFVLARRSRLMRLGGVAR